MAARLAINGFGRIGRLALRAVHELGRDDVDIVAINDSGPIDANAHLLKYDSVHGRAPFSVETDGDALLVGGRRIAKYETKDPREIPWGDHRVDVVLECTGQFKSVAKAQAHIDQGAKKVLISAPGENVPKTIVFGVNHTTLTREDVIVSNGSCTTNCLGPTAHILHETVGVARGFMTTVHSYTSDQPTHDRNHKDFYRGRAAALSMVPTSTGAAKAIGEVLPALRGKLDGAAVRVPAPNTSLVDLKIVPERKADAAAVNAAFEAAAAGAMKGVLAVTRDALVSSDLNHDPHSATIALPHTQVVDGGLVRVLAWYDNEWAFAIRMLDVAGVMARLT